MTDLLDDIKARIAAATIDERINMRLSDGRFLADYTELGALLLSIEGCGVVMEKQKARIAELEAALKQSARVEASLASRIANLMDALEPFAELAPVSWSLQYDMHPIDTDHIRAARAAMAQDQMPEGWSHRNDGWR